MHVYDGEPLKTIVTLHLFYSVTPKLFVIYVPEKTIIKFKYICVCNTFDFTKPKLFSLSLFFFQMLKTECGQSDPNCEYFLP